MPLPRAPAYLQRAGQKPGAADAALLAFHHDVTQMKQLRTHLLGTARAPLVGEHHLADRPAGARSEREQFCGRRERCVVLVGRDGFGGSLAFGDDESAPDGEVGLPMKSAVVGAVRGERHAVGVEVQHRPGVQRDVVLGQGDGYSTAEHDLAGVAQPLLPGFHLLGLDGFRAVPLEAEQHRRQRAVAAAGRRERPVQLHPDIGNPDEHTHAASRSATKSAAARIGPTVCELDGPMPTLKSSKTLMVTESPPCYSCG